MTSPSMHDPSAWRGPELANDPSWIHTLSADEIAESSAHCAVSRRSGCRSHR
jgi:hypothetical protein